MPRRLLPIVLILAALLLPEVQAANPTIVTDLRVTGKIEIASGTSLPGNCGAPVAGVTRLFINLAENEIYLCTALGTWTSMGGLDNPYALNQTFSGIVDFTGTVTFPSNQRTVDYAFPGYQPHWYGALKQATWVDVPVVSSRIIISSFVFITGSDGWTFAVCESRANPSNCQHSVLKGSTNGYKGDYGYSQSAIYYQDRDGLNQVHVLVQPTDADWMTFRAILNYQVN